MARNALIALLLTFGACHADYPKLLTKTEFTSATLAEAVNHYIEMGEEKANKQLDSWTVEPSNKVRIGWICRILFEPKDKKPLRGPLYGALMGFPRPMALENWPLYPIALSGNTYFVLGDRYLLGGHPEDPRDYVRYCRENGTFRKVPVPVPTRRQALEDFEKLMQSKAWKAIKWNGDGPDPWTVRFIRDQADDIPEK